MSLSFSNLIPVAYISFLPYSLSSNILSLILHHLLQGSEMERVKRAIGDLMHLRGTKDRAKNHRQGDLESQPLTISGPIIERRESSLRRSFGHSLLIPRREAKNNSAVGPMGLSPANDNRSPFKPIHPLQMCAPLVRSPAHSIILHDSKKKSDFCEPQNAKSGCLDTESSSHALSGSRSCPCPG